MSYKLYDNFMDAQEGFPGIFKLRTMTAAQIEFRQKLIDSNAAPHKVKQWPIKSKKELEAEGRGNEWPSGALPPLPDPNSEFINGEVNNFFLTNDAWEELYKDFATALREMKNNESRLSLEPTVKDFIDKYYPIFGSWNFTAKSDLEKLINYIESDQNAKDELVSGSSMSFYSKPFSKVSELNKFIREAKEAINTGIYSIDIKDKLIQVAGTVKALSQPQQGMFGQQPAILQNIPNGLGLDNLIHSLDNEDISTNLPKFKSKFAEIYTKMFTLPKVKGAFGKTSTGSNITAHMQEADEIYDFSKSDNENFIDEKIEDELNPIESFQKSFKEKRDNHLKRFVNRHAGWEYENPQAEAIVEAMYKEGFTPQQGLEWILTNKDKVISRLGAGNESIGRWKWLCEQLDLAKKKEKVAFRDALYNADKLDAIKDEMKVNAPKTGAKAKYLVASEILTVIQYEDFTTFSDQKMWETPLVLTSNLSFAKAGTALEPTFKAFDKTIQTGIKYGIRTSKVIVRKFNKFLAATTKTKRLTALEKRLNLDKSNADNKLAMFGVDAISTQIKTKEKDIKDIKKQIEEINNSEDGKKLKNIQDKIKKINDNISSMNQSIIDKNNIINDPNTTPAEGALLTRQRDNIQIQLTNYNARPENDLTNLNAEEINLTAIVNNALGNLPSNLANEEAILKTLQNNMEKALNANGFEQWEYDHASSLVNNAQSQVDALAEMNAFDKKMKRKTRNYNPFASIKDQKKIYYTQLANSRAA